MCLFRRKKEKTKITLPSWDALVEMMYGQDICCPAAYTVINVIYSKDKAHRYLILQSKQGGHYTYHRENLFAYDEEELSYFPHSLHGYWCPVSGDGVHIFDNLESLMRELVAEPDYKTFFTQDDTL